MKQRQRPRVIFLHKQNFRGAISRRPGELALAIIIEHALETRARRATAIERAVAFAQIKISARASRSPGILAEKFFVFRRRQVVKLPREKRVGVIELTAVRRFGFRWRGFRGSVRRLDRTAARSWRGDGRGLIDRKRSRNGRLVDRLGAAHFRSALLRERRRKR